MILFYYFISMATSLVTFNLIKIPRVTPTRASAGVSLLFIITTSGLEHLFLIDLGDIRPLIFGSSFVGMCSHKRFTDLHISIGSLIFTTLYFHLLPELLGLGGSLGLCAFLSTSTIFVLKRFLKTEYI